MNHLKAFAIVTFFSTLSYATDLGDIDQYIENKMRSHKVPGLAVGVVENGQSTLAKGYGYRDYEARLPVTPNTLFSIASLSKAFTGLGALKLSQEGKIVLNTPIKNQWNQFQLATPEATNHSNVIDLLSHQTGQGAHDSMWLGSRTPLFELFKRLPFLEANESFRHGYQYNNLMYMAAGRFMEIQSGRSWREIMEEEIFQKLGMSSTHTSTTLFKENFAHPYWYNGQSALNKRTHRVTDNMGPAASINSNIIDMIKWMNFGLTGFNERGEEIVNRQHFNLWREPQVFAYRSHAPEFSDTYYALGWRIAHYRGQLMWRHGGSIGSFLSYIFLLPETQTGVIVLQNTDEASITSDIGLHIIDKILGVQKSKTSPRQKLLAVDQEWQKRNQPKKLKHSTNMNKYRGTYRNNGYGDLRVSVQNNIARVHYNDWTERFTESSPGVLVSEGVQFSGGRSQSNSQGEITEISLPLYRRTAPIVFQKLP